MKTTISVLFGALALASSAHAADLSVGVGADYWNPQASGHINGVGSGYDNKSEWTVWADVRHPLPLVPNVNLQYTTYDSKGNGVSNDLAAWDLALYYRLFDNDLFGLGGGLDLRQYNGSWFGKDYDELEPLAYLQAEANIPGTSLSVFGDVRGAAWDGNHSHDYRVGMALEFVPKFHLRGGYRNVRLDDNVDGVKLTQNMDGWFAGAEYRF